MKRKKIIKNWSVPKGQELTEFDKKVLAFQNRGELVPKRKLIKTPEQIEGIRRSGVVNTGVLDLIEREIHIGMSTAEIDRLVYEYTTDHGAIPAPLNYEGFPKSVCTSINEVVCHGIPSDDEILEEGDIINVDVSTILDGYYSDASRMFILGETTPEKAKLVRVAKECLEIGQAAAKPWGFVGDIFGAPLAIEGIFAFFCESTFFAVMFFGWKKFSAGQHLAATWLTAFGASLSAWWILVANSWMQYPVGMEFSADQRCFTTDIRVLVCCSFRAWYSPSNQ